MGLNYKGTEGKWDLNYKGKEGKWDLTKKNRKQMGQNYKRWMDVLQFYILFNSISVISGR